ncbi:MAG: M23 family metallopeptidase [Acidobacteriota bacterium]
MTRKSPARRLDPMTTLVLSALSLGLAACSTNQPTVVEPPAAQPNVRAVDVPVDPIVLTPLVWSPLVGTITPVKGTDGKIHLAYELLATNLTSHAVRINGIEVVDPDRNNQPVGVDRVVSFKDEDVTGMARVFGGPATFTSTDYSKDVPALQSGLLYIDVTLPEGAAMPSRLKHRLTLASSQHGSAPVTGVSGIVNVSENPPIVLGPVFKGDGWLNGNGCCTILGPHRYTILPSNGALRDSERYAIDFIRLNSDGRAVIGDVKKLESWPFYGAEILAAAAGKVADAFDGRKDEVPGANPTEVTVESAAGNFVIIDMGEGHFAMYAHLIPGSLKVKTGDPVARGQVIGLLGNSGNSDAPHLHFQVMDRPSPLDAMGLPFVFEQMEYQGRASGIYDAVVDLASAGGQLRISTEGAGTRRMQMPLTLDLIGFK